MQLPLPEFLILATACAPTVAPQTLAPLVQIESGFNPLAINVNNKPRITVRPRSAPEAAATARRLIAEGRSVDLGLAQINSGNLSWLGLSIEDAFDPCRNLAAAARILGNGYVRAGAERVGEQSALRTALSIYNTGDPVRGFNNGYVAKVTGAATQIVPAIQPAAEATSAMVAEPPSLPPPQPWDVFGQTAGAPSFVIRVSTPTDGDPK
jgi:type IV secretion system protein VirB1